MFHMSRMNIAGRQFVCIRNYQRLANSAKVVSPYCLHKGQQTRRWSCCHMESVQHSRLSAVSNRPAWGQRIVRHYSDLPSHQTLVLPALSPTMETGSLVSWEKKIGDEISEGDLLCEIETDKATMGFEASDSGYLARILIESGTKDLPLGTPLCVVVENKEDVEAFANISDEQLRSAAGGDQQQSSSPSPPAAASTSSRPSAGASSADLPQHTAIPLPALSPTMESGTIVSWEKKEGDYVKEGDLLAEIETDKATMGFEASEEGYLAKVFIQAGQKNVPLGTLLCVMVENEEDVAKFASIDAADLGDGSAASAAAGASSSSTAAAGQEASRQQQQQQLQQQQQQAASSGERIKASPNARRLAKEKGIELQSISTASGSDGRIVAADVLRAAEAAPAATRAAAAPASTPAAPEAAANVIGADYTDIQLSNMRSTIAKRLTASKQSIPHYYLTVQVSMDQVLKVRAAANKRLANRDVKLSVNDFVIKAAAVALGRVPEVNSSWQGNFIRQYNRADISIAVATDNGLITPIVFNADAKGLLSINSDVVSLAEKARSNKLKPQEFQGGTFTISNLGMFGIQSFTAIINPPQACILAVGGAQKLVVPAANADDGFTTSTVIQCTLCCDHRVVDGAIGARWLAEFKQCLEDPYNMLL